MCSWEPCQVELCRVRPGEFLIYGTVSAVESKCTACGRIKVYHPERARFNFSSFVFCLVRLTFWRAWEDRALRERNSSAQASVDCETHPLPVWPLPDRDFVFWMSSQPRPKRKTHRGKGGDHFLSSVFRAAPCCSL